jgi:hypothetical protein
MHDPLSHAKKSIYTERQYNVAKCKTPLFSPDATASLGGILTWSKTRGGAYVKILRPATTTHSQAQKSVRATTGFCASFFRLLDEPFKEDWSTLARTENITPANSWVRNSQQQRALNKSPRISPLQPTDPAPAAMSNVSAAVGTNLYTATITPSLSANRFTYLLYRRPGSGNYTTGPEFLVGITPAISPHQVLEFTELHVPSGNHRIKIRCGSIGGVMGAASTGTVIMIP